MYIHTGIICTTYVCYMMLNTDTIHGIVPSSICNVRTLYCTPTITVDYYWIGIWNEVS